MKLAVVLAALALVYPAGRILKKREAWLRFAVIALGALPFLHLESMSVSFFYEYDTELEFRGDSRGLEVALIDILMLVLWVALPRASRRVPMRYVQLLYFLVAAFSIQNAPLPGYSAFAVWKVFRAFFLMGIVVRTFERPRLGPALVQGVAIGVAYAAGYSVYQRYGLGIGRVSATFDHPNTLGMMMLLCYGMIFTLLLANQGRRLAVAATIGTALAVLMTQSRTAIVLLLAGTVCIFLASLRTGITRTKIYILTVGTLASLAVFAVAADTLIDRFINAPEASGMARERFEEAASLISEDYPNGTGINSFSFVLQHRGYAKKAKVLHGDEGGIVHNIYWLTRAEMGWLGLLAYILTLVGPILIAVRTYFKSDRPLFRDMSLGILFSLLAFAAQGFYEWAARQTALLFMYWMLVGILIGISPRKVRR